MTTSYVIQISPKKKTDKNATKKEENEHYDAKKEIKGIENQYKKIVKEIESYIDPSSYLFDQNFAYALVSNLEKKGLTTYHTNTTLNNLLNRLFITKTPIDLKEAGFDIHSSPRVNRTIQGLSIATVVALVTPILLYGGSEIIAPVIIETLSRKGWPLNKDWHTAIGDELNGLMETEERRNRLLGTSSAVHYSGTGFQRVRDSDVYNTKYNLSTERISRIAQAQSVVGYT